MSISVKGVYRNGQVQLVEKPTGLPEADFVVTFSDADQILEDDASRQARRQAALKWLREAGWHLGGAPYPTRDELHGRTR